MNESSLVTEKQTKSLRLKKILLYFLGYMENMHKIFKNSDIEKKLRTYSKSRNPDKNLNAYNMHFKISCKNIFSLSFVKTFPYTFPSFLMTL